jgi:hypothetical protein
VSTALGTWVGHQGLALWVPRGCQHETQIWGRVRVHLIHSSIAVRLPDHPCAIRVSARLQRALLELLPSNEPRAPEAAAAALLAEARDSQLAPLPLRLLRTKRTTPLVEALRRQPALARTLDEWASQLKVSRRTLPRLYGGRAGHIVWRAAPAHAGAPRGGAKAVDRILTQQWARFMYDEPSRYQVRLWQRAQ